MESVEMFQAPESIFTAGTAIQYDVTTGGRAQSVQNKTTIASFAIRKTTSPCFA